MEKEQKKDVALAGSFSLVPATYQEAKEFSELMANSDMVPTAYKGKPGNVLVAVQMGAELGIKPMQAIQNIAVINGKPSIYGDLGTAILRSAGCQIALDDIETIKKNLRARCVITRPGGEKIERTFGKDDAEKAGLWGKQGPWSTYTWRQMGWRAFWFAARDGAADFLKGMRGAEEMLDLPPEVIDVTPAPAGPASEGPKRASETAAASASAPAVSGAESAAAAPTKAEDEIDVHGTVKEVTFKKVGDAFEFLIIMEDSEGPVYLWTKDKPMAERLKKAGEEKTMVDVFFKAGKERNELLRIA